MDNFDNANYCQFSFSTENYVYLVNSNGGTLGQSVKNGVPNESIIEQYTWNGDPVRRIIVDKFFLDQFVIDEDRNKIYLLSSTEDDPLYIYDLPPLQ